MSTSTTMDTSSNIPSTFAGAIVTAIAVSLIALFGFMARWIFGKAIIDRLDKLEREHNDRADKILTEVRTLLTRQGDNDRALVIIQTEFGHLRTELRDHAKEIQSLRDRYHKLTNIVQVREGER